MKNLVLIAIISMISTAAFAQGRGGPGRGGPGPVYGSPVGRGGQPGGPDGPGRPGGGFGGGPGQGGPGRGAPGPVYGSPVGHGGGYGGGYGRPPVIVNRPPVIVNRPPIIVNRPVYRPIFGGPQIRFPNYPVYQTFPQGPCTVYTNNNYSGGAFYSVTNSYGQTISTSYDYYQAYSQAQLAQSSGQCSYITTVNNSYAQPNLCTIAPGADAYGNQFYRVLDAQGRIISTANDYQSALSISQSSQSCFSY